MDACDLEVSIGGDGTFLYAARGAGSTPVLGVNLGEVGFLNAVSPAAADVAVEREDERFLQRGSVRRQPLMRVRVTGEGWSLPPALNEVAVLADRRGPGGGMNVEVRVDGNLYSGSHADGALVSTPAGSTAYNLAAGGPLVTPDVDGPVVTELCATDPMPSLVVGGDREVSIRVDLADRATVVCDGRSSRSLDPPTRMTVVAADEPAHIAGPPLAFFRALGKLD